MSYKSEDPLPRSKNYITENGTAITALVCESSIL